MYYMMFQITVNKKTVKALKVNDHSSTMIKNYSGIGFLNTKTAASRKWSFVIRNTKGHNFQPGVLNPAKLAIKINGIKKIASNKQDLQKFTYHAIFSGCY